MESGAANRQMALKRVAAILFASMVTLPVTVSAVEQLDESSMADIHFPGLPATAGGKAETVAESASDSAHAETRKTLITANEISQPLSQNDSSSMPEGTVTTSTTYTRDNAFAELTHADVVINLDKANDKTYSQNLEHGVSINLSNTVNQIEASNLRDIVGAESSRGNIAIEALAVDVNIIINAR